VAADEHLVPRGDAPRLAAFAAPQRLLLGEPAGEREGAFCGLDVARLLDRDVGLLRAP